MIINPDYHFISGFIIHQIFPLARDWSKCITWVDIPQLKLGNIREYSPIFKTACVVKKIWRIINTTASIWSENMLGYFVLGHYLFPVAHSFPRATLSQNSLLLGTDNVRGQISKHIFAPNRGYCLYMLYGSAQMKNLLVISINNFLNGKSLFDITDCIRHQLLLTLSGSWTELQSLTVYFSTGLHLENCNYYARWMLSCISFTLAKYLSIKILGQGFNIVVSSVDC